MKRILFAMIFGYIFGAVVFGQQPVNVELQPLINFDGVIDEIMGLFGDVLKEFWLLFLSMFLIWFMFNCLMSFLQNRVERWKSERRMRHSMVFRENLRAEQQDLRRELRRQELEQSRIAAKSEVE